MRKIQTLVLLLTAYAAAIWLPGPGLYLHELPLFWESIKTPQVLLAVLLFCAGLCSSRDAVRTIMLARARFLTLAFAAWLLPLLSAVLAVLLLWGLLGCPPSVALGILIVAAMPVANSSVGWSASLGGSVTLSIALLVLGTALSPVLTPLIIHASASTIGTAEETLIKTPWNEGMELFFLRWVLLPVLLGVLTASRLDPARSAFTVPLAKQVGFYVLIGLNYLNGAACLPALAQQPQLLFWPLGAATSLLLTSAAMCKGLATLPVLRSVLSPIDAQERLSVLLAVLMHNTGAALVFAGAALPEFVLVSITIIAYTMLQHLWVAFFLAHDVGHTAGVAAQTTTLSPPQHPDSPATSSTAK